MGKCWVRAERYAVDQRFAQELNTALRYRSMTSYELAHKLDLPTSTTWAWTRGKALPSHEMAVNLADSLGWTQIAVLSLQIRHRVCLIPECQAEFYDNSKRMNKRYCSEKCMSAAHMRANRGRKQEKVVITMRRVQRYEDAVNAFCRRCTDHLCPDAKCELRPVSMMPLRRGKPLAILAHGGGR